MDKERVSMAVVRRLPRYYQYVLELSDAGVERVSSNTLAEKMGLTASQIRQDLNCFGGFGQQGYGYNVSTLKQELASILGIDRGRRAIIIGVGNMGRALVNNFNFKKNGVVLLAGFDTSPGIVGSLQNGIIIKHMDELDSFQEEFQPEIAILTLPKAAAQRVCERLCKNGIKGIWNFTTVDLHLEGINVPVENIRFAESLMTLSYLL